MKRFGVMLDNSRNAVMKPEKIKEFVSILSNMGYNTLMLYTEDTYEVNNEPYFGYMRGRYSKEELKDVVKFCNEKNVEVIPCIQTLAHLNQIFKWPIYKKINDTNDILLTENDRTYSLIENMIKTVKECFTSNYIHIGMDEAHMLGLGKYLDINGYKNRFDILFNHLNKVIEICEKHDLKPIMWSDMFMRLANNGEYYTQNPKFTDEVVNFIPKNLGLVYWDYYHFDKKYYEKMMKAHLSSKSELWFAGGAWCWSGFQSGNNYTLRTMIPAMKAAKKYNVDNVIMTMWGDNGKECSFYPLLPSLFAVKKYFDGETNLSKIKKEFNELTGENFDSLCLLDNPVKLSKSDKYSFTATKNMLYSDPFTGFLDSTVIEQGASIYKSTANKLSYAMNKSKNYKYLFQSARDLAKFMSIKYDIGLRTRLAYQNKDIDQLKKLVLDYKKAESLLNKFYLSFKNLWFIENKPHGFDVHDLRLGGLKQRLISCRLRLEDFINNKIDSIPELEEKLLDYYGNNEEFRRETPYINIWSVISSVNVI